MTTLDSIPGSVTRPTEEEREIAELKAEVERLREDALRRKEQFECRVRCCVNPRHLEAVTQRENLRRGRVARGGN